MGEGGAIGRGGPREPPGGPPGGPREPPEGPSGRWGFAIPGGPIGFIGPGKKDLFLDTCNDIFAVILPGGPPGGPSCIPAI